MRTPRLVGATAVSEVVSRLVFSRRIVAESRRRLRHDPNLCPSFCIAVQQPISRRRWPIKDKASLVEFLYKPISSPLACVVSPRGHPRYTAHCIVGRTQTAEERYCSTDYTKCNANSVSPSQPILPNIGYVRCKESNVQHGAERFTTRLCAKSKRIAEVDGITICEPVEIQPTRNPLSDPAGCIRPVGGPSYSAAPQVA